MTLIDYSYCRNLEGEERYSYLNNFALLNISKDELLKQPNEYLHFKLIILNGKKVTEYL